jgi:hypothetical protein
VKSLIVLTAAVVAAATLTTASTSEAAPQGKATVRQHDARQHGSRSVLAEVVRLRHGIVWHRSRTWHFQHELGVHRTPTRYAERHTRSVAYLHWLHGLWSARRVRAKHAFLANRLPSTGDWMTAVRIAQRTWPGTSAWMLSCSGAEGAHGVWVWNGGLPYSAGGAPPRYGDGYRTPPYGSSGAGGWMQYMKGTWQGQFDGAIRLAHSEHLPMPDRRDWSWTSPIGQAFAAGYGYSYARSAWTGDPACA